MDFSIFDSFDMSVFTFFGEHIHSSFMNVVAEIITFFGGEEFVIPMAVLGLVLSLFKKTRKFGLSVLFAVLVGTLLTNLVMKNVFDRPRPFDHFTENPIYAEFFKNVHGIYPNELLNDEIKEQFNIPTSYSFPSGHTTAAFELGIAMFLALKKKYSWVFPVFSALVGLSRIYLMVHYVTDVLGGMVIGTLAGVVGYLIMKAIMEKTKINEFDLIETIKKKKA